MRSTAGTFLMIVLPWAASCHTGETDRLRSNATRPLPTVLRRPDGLAETSSQGRRPSMGKRLRHFHRPRSVSVRGGESGFLLKGVP
jgi:hypothetical protein